MRTQLVVLFLSLKYSTCWKMQVNATQKSHNDWMNYQQIIPFGENVSKITPSLLLLAAVTSDVHLTSRLPADGVVGYGITSEDYLLQSTAAVSKVENRSPSRREEKEKYLKIIDVQNSGKVPVISSDAALLRRMLVALIKQELRECDLVLAYDGGYSHQEILKILLLVSNPRQVMRIKTARDFLKIRWESSMCRGYLFLLDNPKPLLTFANISHHKWDYHGRFVLVGPSLEHLDAFTASRNGKKTEHILGMVKSSAEGEWVLYMNQLYWGQGVRRINTWRRHRFTHQLGLFPDKLSDLQGAVLRVTAFMFEPSIMYHRAPNGTLLFRYGLDIAVTKTVAQALNFTIDFMEPPNGETWGEKSENGSWSGMAGQLERDEADVGIADVFVSNFRADALDFSAPYTSEMMCFLACTEPPLPRWQALAFPFHFWTWLAILAGLIVSGPLLFLVAWCSGRCGDEVSSLQSLSFSCYYAFGVHFCEAHVSLPRMASTQIFVLFLWLYTMILTIAYSTNLRALLIVRKPPAMMDTIRDLYDTGLQVAGIGDFVKSEMSSSSDPYLQGLVKVFKGYDTRNEIYPLVLEGKAVFLGSRLMLEFLVNNKFIFRGVPLLRIMKENFAPYSIAMALQRHSPLKRKVDQVIGWIRQSGLVRHFFLDSLRQAAVYEKDGDGDGDADGGQEVVVAADGVIPLGLDHMQGIFLVTGAGWVFSLLVLLLEKTVTENASDI